MLLLKIKKEIEIAGTRWLSFKEVEYVDKLGKDKKWSYIERKGKPKIVTMICKSKNNKYLIITQPRVPLNKIVVEFPSGLVDKGESVEDAALRELKEETGYDGKILSIGPEISKSAGLTNETSITVFCSTNMKEETKTNMEETEDIISHWMTPKQFITWSKKLDPNKFILDIGVWFFFQGINTKK